MSSAISVETSNIGWGRAIVRSAACLAGVVLIFALAVTTPFGQRLDSWLMGVGFNPLPRPIEALQLLRKGSLFFLGFVVAGTGVAAMLRREWKLVMRCVVLVIGSVAVATLLRRVLIRPELGDPTYPVNTWPSGHVAASAALVVSALVLVPASLNTVVVRRAGALTLLVVAGASLATLAHRPSDVIASMLWVAALSALLCPSGPVGWRALKPDVKPALVSAGVAAVFSLVPWVNRMGLLANGAWLLAAVLLTIGWNGPMLRTNLDDTHRLER